MSTTAYLLEFSGNLLLVVALVLLNAFFVAAEFAIVKVRDAQLRILPAGPRRDAARHVVHHLDAYLSACQLGITIASLGLGWIGEPAVSHFMVEPLFGRFIADPDTLQGVSFAIAFIVITAVHIVVGEQAPKYIGIRDAKKVALWVAVPLRIFRSMFAPLIWFLNVSANGLVRLLGMRPMSEEEGPLTIDELRILLAQVPQTAGAVQQRSAQVAGRVFSLHDVRVREIMIPRDRMVCLDIQKPFEENLRLVKEHPFTRFPLADGGPDSILGFVHHRDVFAAAEKSPPPRLEDFRRQVASAATNQRASALLFEMLEKRRQMAIVLDEQGNTVGLLTLEDIFEQVVGQIPGEFDRLQLRVHVLAPNHYYIDASIPLPELQLVLREPLPQKGVATLGGLLQQALGRTPTKGDRVEVGNYLFSVLEADAHGVRRVEVFRRGEPVAAVVPT